MPPVLAAIGGGLAALGGGSAAVGAGIAATAVGTVGSVISSNNAANAYQKAGQQVAESNAEALKLQQDIYNQNRADNEPFRQLGMASLGALAGGLGITGYNGGSIAGAPTMTGGGYSTGTSGSTSIPGVPTVDATKYLQDNPDAAANFAELRASGRTDAIATDPTAFVMNHWRTDGERRDLPMVTPTPPDTTTPATNSTGQASGYTDPTAPNGYTMAARPDYGSVDVSIDAFRASPDYNFRVSEGNKALDRIAAASGGIMSGQRYRAAARYNQDLADAEYSDWRNYQTNQFNNNRAFSESVYQGDRANLNNRYDTRNSTLLNLAGFGSTATSNNQNAATNYANAGTNLMTSTGQARADATTGAANAWNQGIGNLMTAGTYLAGRYAGGGGGSYTWPGPYPNGGYTPPISAGPY